jgi:hypothetical protein
MELVVVLVFVFPLLVGTAIVGVKMLEFALNSDIASAKSVARWATIVLVGTTALAVVAWFVWLVITLSGDPS